MSTQKSGRIANKIHAAYKARKISAPKAIHLLEELDIQIGLSETQSRKLSELIYGYSHNRHMFDENGFWMY